MSESEYTSIHYHEYLQLDSILDSQKLRSEALGKPAHDEMLFIIMHQVYELWFKEIIHDLSPVLEMFNKDEIDEKNIGIAVQRFDRVNTIMRLLTDQIRVLETMTPLDFLDFRNYLLPASGFQSFQFRKVEVLLGLKNAKRTTYAQKDYKSVFEEEQQKELDTLEAGNSLLQAIGNWLERTPFLNLDGFNFVEQYETAVNNMINKESEAIAATDHITQEQKEIRQHMLRESLSNFRSIFSEDAHDQMVKDGTRMLSYKSTLAVLLINLYRDEPILHLPYQLLSTLSELEDLFTSWRYRHAQMVLKMLGKKMGTGGSSGHEYLKKTAQQHHIFIDLQNISTLLIPRSELPVLPNELKEKLGFYYSAK